MSGFGGVRMAMALDVLSSVSSVSAVLDDRPVAKRIGLVALATDHTTETDFARILHGYDVGVYVAPVVHKIFPI